MDLKNQLKNCCIAFDNRPNGIYYAGEMVSGSANLTLNKTRKYYEIILRVQGFSEVNWSETQHQHHHHHHHHHTGHNRHGSSHHSRTVSYSAKEVYFKTYTNLIQPTAPESAQEFASGLHKFTFSFALPINVPSSFEGTFGRARYEIKVTVKQPHKKDYCYKALFTVLSLLNLNQLQGVAAPYSVTKSNNYYFLLSKKGSCHMTIEVPRTGFVCGEMVPLKCIINNQSKVKVEQLKITLYQIVTYIAQVPHYKMRSEGNRILCELSDGVDKMSETVKDILISLPALPSTSLNYCSTITINYSIKVKAKMNGVHEDMSCEFPITVGTVPFMNQQPNHMMQTPSFNPLYQPQYLDPTPQASSVPSAPVPTMDRLDPPTYEEAMGGGNRLVNNNEEYGNYNPRYPVYHFEQNNEKKN